MIATHDDITELVIKEAHKDDTGTYDLVLENKCGRKAVYIKVNISSGRTSMKMFISIKSLNIHLEVHFDLRFVALGEGDWPS